MVWCVKRKGAKTRIYLKRRIETSKHDINEVRILILLPVSDLLFPTRERSFRWCIIASGQEPSIITCPFYQRIEHSWWLLSQTVEDSLSSDSFFSLLISFLWVYIPDRTEYNKILSQMTPTKSFILFQRFLMPPRTINQQSSKWPELSPSRLRKHHVFFGNTIFHCWPV